MTHPFAWDRAPSYWQDQSITADYEPQGEPCSTCGRHTTPGHRYMCGTCLSVTCEDDQDREPCAVCQRLHDDERDFSEVDGQFGLGLLNPCPYMTCGVEGIHRHRVTLKEEPCQ